ncbi:MAG: hypothetical protein R3C68_00005 [Myxococcota bacterium]
MDKLRLVKKTVAVIDTITYTNRKDDTYYLGAVKTKTGKTRYVFARKPNGEPVPEVPEGYEIAENVHGQVSLRKITPSAIFDLELRQVRSALKEHAHLADCRAEVKGKRVIIYEAHNVGLGLEPMHGKFLGRYACYNAVMRFNLVNTKERTFVVERMCYRGSMEGWLDIHDRGSIGKLARKYLKHVGKESFYSMPWG